MRWYVYFRTCWNWLQKNEIYSILTFAVKEHWSIRIKDNYGKDIIWWKLCIYICSWKYINKFVEDRYHIVVLIDYFIHTRPTCVQMRNDYSTRRCGFKPCLVTAFHFLLPSVPTNEVFPISHLLSTQYWTAVQSPHATNILQVVYLLQAIAHLNVKANLLWFCNVEYFPCSKLRIISLQHYFPISMGIL
jgi:hypothetical protein